MYGTFVFFAWMEHVCWPKADKYTLMLPPIEIPRRSFEATNPYNSPQKSRSPETLTQTTRFVGKDQPLVFSGVCLCGFLWGTFMWNDWNDACIVKKVVVSCLEFGFFWESSWVELFQAFAGVMELKNMQQQKIHRKITFGKLTWQLKSPFPIGNIHLQKVPILVCLKAKRFE